MEQYRIYLRAELGKLHNTHDGAAFLEATQAGPARFGLPGDPSELATRFASQELVDTYVERLGDQELVSLTTLCDTWRKNGIAGQLTPLQDCVCVDVPIEHILLNQAEPWLGCLWRMHGYRLVAIARDPVLRLADPYAERRSGEGVAVCRCLASPCPGPWDIPDLRRGAPGHPDGPQRRRAHSPLRRLTASIPCPQAPIEASRSFATRGRRHLTGHGAPRRGVTRAAIKPSLCRQTAVVLLGGSPIDLGTDLASPRGIPAPRIRAAA